MSTKEILNLAVRKAMAESGVRQWQVADAYGCTEREFSRKLRYELSASEKRKVLEIIEQLSSETEEPSEQELVVFKRRRNNKLNIAKQMPLLQHSFPDQDFDIKNSEVVKWLVQQPDIMQLLFNIVRYKEIIFNPETGTWQGKDYAT